jgi:hypothetical protein
MNTDIIHWPYNINMDETKKEIEPLENDGVIEVGTHGHPVIRDIRLAATGEIHRVTCEEPDHQRVLASGAILDTVTGAFLKGPPRGGAYAITKENQGEKKGDFFQQRAQEIVRGAMAKHTKHVNWEGGADSIAGRIIQIALDGGNRDSIEAAKFIFGAAGLLRDRRYKDQPDGVQVSISADVAKEMLAMLRDRREIIDGQIIDED